MARSAGVPVGADGDLTAEARIRRSALELFADCGYHGTSTRAIAGRAGVSPALVLHHFGSKEALRRQVDQDVVATIEQLFAPMIPPDGEVRFEEWIQGYRKLFREHRPLAAYLRRSLLEQTDWVYSLYEPVIRYAEGFVRSLIGRGAAREPTDLQATVALVAGMSLTSVILEHNIEQYLGDDEPIDTRLAAAELEFMLEGLLRLPPRAEG